MIRRALLGVAVLAAAGAIWRMTPVAKHEPDKRPIITVQAQLLDTVTDYLRDNGLDAHEAELRALEVSDSTTDYLVARAPDRFADDPGGIILQYNTPDCTVTLPAGRQFAFGFEGPFLQNMDAILPLEPLDWDQMQIMVAETNASFASAGWTRDTDSPWDNAQITAEGFLKSKASGSNALGAGVWRHCAQDFVIGYVSVMHYNEGTAGSFMPPASLGTPLPDDAPDRFLLRVQFNSYTLESERPDPGPELRMLRDMRRIAVNEDRNTALPLAVWIDDPDWRPEDWIGEYVK